MPGGRIAALAAFCCLIAAVAHAQSAGSPQTPPAAPAKPLADASNFRLVSAATGRAYRIYVATPSGYRRSGGPYPVIYALDGNMQFRAVAEISRALTAAGAAPATVVVAIGYDEPGEGMQAAFAGRTADMTPTASASDLAVLRTMAAQRGYPTPTDAGGAKAFLRFIEHELSPRIQRRYAVDHRDRTLVGHSFGGLFAAWTLAGDDGFFRRYVIGSPSLWWDRQTLLRAPPMPRRWIKGRTAPRAWFGAGELEGVPGSSMVSDLKLFVALMKLRGDGFAEIEAEVTPGADHVAMIAQTLRRGLSSVYRRGKP